jgi:hypothetical protein
MSGCSSVVILAKPGRIQYAIALVWNAGFAPGTIQSKPKSCGSSGPLSRG